MSRRRGAVLLLAGLASAPAPLGVAGCDGGGPARGPEATAPLRFSDQAAAAGVAGAGPSFAAAAADFDRDGWPDLAVSTHGSTRLFRNREGRFEEISAAVGLVPEDTHGLSWIDLDRDGRLDLLVAIGARRGFGTGDNQVYRNLGGGSLARERAVPEVLRDPAGRGRCLVAVDLDRDGRLDVAVVNLVQEGRWSRLARATEDGGWGDAGDALGVARLAAECLTAVHLDRSRTPTLIGYGGGADAGRAFRPGAGGALVDVTAELGIPPGRHTVHAVAAGDYDNDGDLDLYFVRGHHIPPAVVALENGLGFRLTVNEPGRTPPFRFRCAGDFEADLLIGFNRLPRSIHLGDRGAHPRSIPWRVGRGDSALEGAPEEETALDLGLHLWRSAPDEYAVVLAGDGQRVQGASGIVRGEGGPCAIVEVPAELRRPPPQAPNLLLENDGGRFRDVTAEAGAGDPGSGRDAAFLDADNDGDLDLFVVNGGLAFGQQPDALYLNRGDGTFADASGPAGIAGPDAGRGATVTALDYDRDGGVDLFVTNGDGPPLGNDGPYSLWRNETAPRGNWIAVDLEGGAGNPTAVGASVLATFDGRRLLAERTSSNGRFSTGVLPLHFGLGEATAAELEVAWPSERTSRATAAAGERLLLREPPPEPDGGREP